MSPVRMLACRGLASLQYRRDPPGGVFFFSLLMFPLTYFSDIGYESLINLMLKDLFKLLVSCVSEPAETISRVGCSCIRSEVT